MKGDFTRDTFDPSNHFTRVLSQQGRVQLDADMNEQTAILLHYLHALAVDLIGPHGGPADITRINQNKQEELIQLNCGFEIIATEGRIKQLPEADTKKNDLIDLLKKSKPPLLLGKGRYYVDGILAENPEYIAFSDQPGYPFLDNGGDLQGNYLIYLDVWVRHLTSLELTDATGSAISNR